MSTVNTLLEGASPFQVLQEQAGKLAGKWERSGLLEGIESSTNKNNMAMLLENQAKQLVNEANSTSTAASFSSGNSEAWAGVALPLVRRVFGEIVAQDLISVQPMNLPAGLIFYLDFQYGNTTSGFTAGQSLYSATGDMKKTNIPKQGERSGLYGAGTFAYSSPTASVKLYVTGGKPGTDTVETRLSSLYTTTSTNGGYTASLAYLTVNSSASINYDAEFVSNNTMTSVQVLRVPTAAFSDHDIESVRAWKVSSGSGTSNDKFMTMYGQFAKYTAPNSFVDLVMASGSNNLTGGTLYNNLEADNVQVHYLKGPDNLNDVGDYEEGKSGVSDGFAGAGSVSTMNIPEINVQMRSDTVAAKTRKLKAQWTPEFAQDLNAYHSIDAEAELTSILSEYISMEIDLEILDMLIRNADTVEYWSAKIAREMDVNGGNTDLTSGVYYTKMSWYQTLGVKLQKVSNLIHQKTLRGGANWMVISPKVSTILESIPGFAADSAGDDNKYNMGVQKIGAINNRYTVYKNPYMTENIILMGYKGSQFLETGAVFAPYIPLIMTPLVYDPVSFTPRKGIMTRYAKKMVRPDFYGAVYCNDLDQV